MLLQQEAGCWKTIDYFYYISSTFSALVKPGPWVTSFRDCIIYIYRWFAHRWSVVKPINRFSQPPLAGVHPEASEYGSLRPWNLGTSQTWTVGTCWKMLKLWNFGIAAAWRLYSANFSNMLFKLPVLLQLKVTKLLQWEDRASSGKKLELQDLCRW